MKRKDSIQELLKNCEEKLKDPKLPSYMDGYYQGAIWALKLVLEEARR